jgi:hypothetical protein
MRTQCSEGHVQTWKCHATQPIICRKCEHETEMREKKKQRDFELQQKRDADQKEYNKKLALLDEEIEHQRQELIDTQQKKTRDQILAQRKKDLKDAVALATKAAKPSIQPSHPQKINTASQVPPPPPIIAENPSPSSSGLNTSEDESKDESSTSVVTASETTLTPQTQEPKLENTENPFPSYNSPSEEEWQRQKDMENANNDAIDTLMNMIGLENVKSQVLRIKAKIDTTQRQGVDMKDERFNAVFLGNPGTGKIYCPTQQR